MIMSSRKHIVSPAARKKGKQNATSKTDKNQIKKKESSARSTKKINSYFLPVSCTQSLCRQNKVDVSNNSMDTSLGSDNEVICPSPQSGFSSEKSGRQSNPLKLKLKRRNIEKCIVKDDDVILINDDSDKSEKSSPDSSCRHPAGPAEENVSFLSTCRDDEKCIKKCAESSNEQIKDSLGDIVKNDCLSNGIERASDDIISIISTYSDTFTKSVEMQPKEDFDSTATVLSSSPVNKCDDLKKIGKNLCINGLSDNSCAASFADNYSNTKFTDLAPKNQVKRKSTLSEDSVDCTMRKKQHVDDSDVLTREAENIKKGEISDIDLDDTFGEVDLDSIMSTKSGSVVQNFVDIDNDLDDVMLPEDDAGVLYTWKVSDITFSSVSVSGRSINEKVLSLKLQGDEINATCFLREDWYLMKIMVNDIVYVSALSKSNRSCVLDNTSKHYLIMYPNTLISGTTIASGITCERSAVLSERFKVGFTNKAMFLGTLTHDLFDWVLRHRGCSVDDIEKRARESLDNTRHLESLNMIGVDTDGIIRMQKEYHSSLEKWSKQFMGENFTDINLKMGDEREDCSTGLRIDKIVDIEENIWSPHYGLKGKIDATVEVTIHRKPKLSSGSSERKYRLPLEFKTGKLWAALGSIEHRAQVAVYTLMMCERYSIPVDFGLLFYGKDNHMIGVPRPEQEKRAIIIKRNEIARNLTLERQELELPELIQNKRLCKRCDQNSTCMLYFKSLENGDAAGSGVDELFMQLTSHLCTEDLQYFAKWYELCIIEASYADKGSRDKYIWKYLAEDREKQGLCFSGMKRDSFEELDKGRTYLYKFRRKDNHFDTKNSLKLVPLGCGERVIISEENRRVYNITTGYITDVSSDILTVKVQREVRAISGNREGAIYRIDKDDTLSNHATPLSNLSKLFTVNSPSDEKLRKLIIMGEKPRFSDDKEKDIAHLLRMTEDQVGDSNIPTPGKVLSDILAELNIVQQSAIKKCLTAEDYVLIHGMPGAGKSTTIACLVRALVSVGKSVLLSSYTHSAVDTILKKLLKVGFNDFLRIGASSRVHERIIPYTYEEQIKSFSDVQQFKELYTKQIVVASTCLGVNHAFFTSRRFDYCIVDEASQITQPVCIGPLRNADIFILVGDHNQLPPLVVSQKAQQKGLDCSLFKSLSDFHHDAVVMLNYQYRMNESIMLLMNTLVYESHMKCGNEEVANSTLELPAYEKLYEEANPNQLWDIVNPKTPVTFVNTDNADLREEKSGSYIINKGEAKLVKKFVNILIQCGLSHCDVGVISMYRQQVNLIREELRGSGGFIEVDTMDKYQGKDKKCIIVSFVRSNSMLEVGELLKDWRRINVAITRAKSKLILIGSRKTIGHSGMLCKLVDLIDSQGWCVELT